MFVVAELKKAGVEKCVMLTGDAKKVANQVASSLGIDEVYSELLPADKVDKVEELLRVKLGKAKLAFVGDGINDAPVLSRADIGIAMGAMGSDVCEKTVRKAECGGFCGGKIYFVLCAMCCCGCNCEAGNGRRKGGGFETA